MGRYTNISYNDFGEKSEETTIFTDSNFSITQQFNYDQFGRLIENKFIKINGTDSSNMTNAETFLTKNFTYDEKTGRLISATHNSASVDFQYLPNTDFINKRIFGNGIEQRIELDTQRDLPTSIGYFADNHAKIQRNYAYDSLGNVISRQNIQEEIATRQDLFTYNPRQELTDANYENDSYNYVYDHLGNRKTATELGQTQTYTTNNYNQYTKISGSVTPTYDYAGNQTKIETIVDGIKNVWTIEYCTENRPIKWTSGTKKIEMKYENFVHFDLGRRYSKKVFNGSALVSEEIFIYQDFVQIACFYRTNPTEGFTLKHTVFWDPSEPIATRPIAIENFNKNSTVNSSENSTVNPNENPNENPPEIKTFYYAHDANKNVTALFNSRGNIAQTYDYSPFGKTLRIDSNSVTSNSVTLNSITSENSVNSNSNLLENSINSNSVISENSERFSSTEIIENPFQFSSEYHDSELNLIYYNYRHYNPQTARWLSRDPIEEQGGINLYNFLENDPINKFDLLGLTFKIVYNVYTRNRCKVTAHNLERLDSYAELNEIEKLINDAINNSSFWEKFKGHAGYNLNQNKRYSYSTDNEWIDLQHLISSATIPFAAFGSGIIGGIVVEIKQSMLNYDSAWQDEDLLSNYLGSASRFLAEFTSNKSVGESAYSLLKSFNKILTHKEAWNILCEDCEEN